MENSNNDVKMVNSTKTKYEKIIIDEFGNVTFPLEEVSEVMNITFEEFMRFLNEEDSIYYDSMTGRYMARINGVKYHIDFSDGLVAKMEKGLDTEFVKMLRKRMNSEKVDNIRQMVNEGEEFPTSYEEIDIYEDILENKYRHTKAKASRALKSILNNFVLAGAGAAGALCSAAYVTDRSWSWFIILMSLSAAMGGTVNAFERLPQYDKISARKKRLKNQTEDFNQHVKELVNEDIESLKERRWGR